MSNSVERIIPHVVFEEAPHSSDTDSSDPVQSLADDMFVLHELENISSPHQFNPPKSKLSDLFRDKTRPKIVSYAMSTLMDTNFSDSSSDDEIIHRHSSIPTSDIPTPDLHDINSLPLHVARVCQPSKYICDTSKLNDISIDMALERQRTFSQFLDSEFNRFYEPFKRSAFGNYYSGILDSAKVYVYDKNNIDSLDEDLTTACMINAHLCNIHSNPTHNTRDTDLKYHKYFVLVLDVDSVSTISEGNLAQLVLRILRKLFIYIGHNLIVTFNVIPSDSSNAIHDALIKLVHNFLDIQSKVEHILPDSEHIFEETCPLNSTFTSHIDQALKLAINHNFVKEMTYSLDQIHSLQDYVDTIASDVRVDRIFTYNFLHTHFDIVRDKQFRRYAKMLSFDTLLHRKSAKHENKFKSSYEYDCGPYSDFLHRRKPCRHTVFSVDSSDSSSSSSDDEEYAITRPSFRPRIFKNINNPRERIQDYQPVVDHFHSARGTLIY